MTEAMPYVPPNVHFLVNDKSVYVSHVPKEEIKPHDIGILSSGDFEVHCHCPKLCGNNTIKEQISYVQQTEKEQHRLKKNQ
jgi:hypothetical protein